MIIQELMDFWSAGSGMKEIFSQFDEMMVISKKMFEKASNNIFNPSKDIEGEARLVVKLDGKLNALQQNIRRDIVIHISVEGSKDILPSLLLMSLVKDAERLGDYAKNVMEIAEKKVPFIKGDHYESLRNMRSDIMKWFDETKHAFDKVDKKKAAEVVETAYKTAKECDDIVWSLIDTKKKDDALALGLLFRFFKRIAAHLGNICSSVTMPLDKLDYYDE